MDEVDTEPSTWEEEDMDQVRADFWKKKGKDGL